MAQITKSKISNTEWGLVLGAFLIIDLVQFLLDLFFESGVIINRFIDIGVEISYSFYLWIRGEVGSGSDDMTMKVLGMVATFLGEEIPDLDALPFWSLDHCYNWWLAVQNNKKWEKQNEVQIKAQQIQVQQDQQQKMTRLQMVRDRQQQEQSKQVQDKQLQQSEVEEEKEEIKTLNIRNDRNTTEREFLAAEAENKRMREYQQSSNDALDQLNKKSNRTREDNIKLSKAADIMRNGSISNDDKSDPVLMAAWNKHNAGIRPFNGIVGYKFANVL